MKIQSKVAFVTDADSASGKALILRLASEGAKLVLNSVSSGAAIESETAYCRNLGASFIITNVNLCNEAEVNEMLEGAANQLGPVDILIHNNNLVIPASVEECSEELFWQIMDFNTKSAFVCTRAAGRYMESRQSGKIVYVSSIHDEKPTGSAFAYSASKGAVQMLCREAALYLGRNGVQANVIEMGPVEGDNVKFRSDISDLYKHYRTKVPNAVLGTHQDLADVAVFLASDESRYVNGASIRVDGGFELHLIDLRMKTV